MSVLALPAAALRPPALHSLLPHSALCPYGVSLSRRVRRGGRSPRSGPREAERARWGWPITQRLTTHTANRRGDGEPVPATPTPPPGAGRHHRATEPRAAHGGLKRAAAAALTHQALCWKSRAGSVRSRRPKGRRSRASLGAAMTSQPAQEAEAAPRRPTEGGLRAAVTWEVWSAGAVPRESVGKRFRKRIYCGTSRMLGSPGTGQAARDHRGSSGPAFLLQYGHSKVHGTESRNGLSEP